MASGQRSFTDADADVRRVLLPGLGETVRQTVVYCRVSAPGRKVDLDSRVRIERGGTVVIAHKDRLARFGYEYLEYVAERNGCAILVASQGSLSPPEEMVQDLLSIVHTFSYRLHGLRGYEKTLKAGVVGGGR